MTIYCRPAFPMSTLSTLIVSALVRYHLLRDIMSDNGSVFLIPGSFQRKNDSRVRQFEHPLIWGNKNQLTHD